MRPHECYDSNRMTVETTNPQPQTGAKPRPRSELIMRLIQPLADLLVGLLAKTGINPLSVVMTHALLGFAAAALLMAAPGDGLLIAALLLQLKTLLDNVDGGLARVTGQVTKMGRYVDTVMDFLVNTALFVALAFYGPPLLALLGFLILTVILSFDYNFERLYQRLRLAEQSQEELPRGAPAVLYNIFKGCYELLFAPQDKLIEGLERRRFLRLTGLEPETAPLHLRLAWHDMFSTAALVNLGLSTQLFLLGVFLAIGQPFWYVYSLFIQALYVLCVQFVRALRFMTYVQSARAESDV